MVYSRSAFATTLLVSFIVSVVVLGYVFATPAVLANLPLADVVGIGGLYFQADGFSGEVAEAYPVKGSSTGQPIDANTPVCQSRPMIAIDLQQANVDGFTARKDIKLPHLSDRWMSIEISQGSGSSINGEEITFFVTQLFVDRLDLRNVLIREARPPVGSFEPAEEPPEDQTQVTNEKWGPGSGEFYLKAGFGPPVLNRDGLVASKVDEDYAAAAWLHGLTAREITFESGGLSAIELDISFPTDNGLENFYRPPDGDNLFGYDEPTDNNFNSDRDEGYFDCLPVEDQ